MTKNFYITTPIYYVNGEPHIGSAYTSIAVDVMARFKRLDGYNVKFLTGTDEHGLKVYQTARDKNIDPQEFCNQVSQKFRDLSPMLNLSNDDFIRTTDERHKKTCQAFWQKLQDNGQIYLSKYSGWYAVRDEAYYTEEELGTNAAGEKICIATGSPVAWMEEESYFFRLSAWQEPLLEFYKKNPDAVYPKTRMNEVLRFIEGGLQDLSISRTNFPWGVAVPNDPNHVMYVWIDALVNYLSALGYPEDESQVKDFWPHVEHVMAKEITRFHAVYWPAFLMAAHLTPPKRVIAHGWLTAEGQKMSKSLGNFIVPKVLIDEFGLDPLRYYLMRDFSFGQDGDFSRAQFVQRINSDLANDLGNLAQRVLAFVYKNANATLPTIGVLSDIDRDYLAQSGTALLNKVRDLMADYQYHKALDEVWAVIRQGNIYVDEQAPWALKKTDETRMATVLAVLLETVRRVCILLQPFMPDSMDKMLTQLHVPQDKRSFADLNDNIGLTMGAAIDQPQGLFPRFDVDKK